MKKQLWTSFVNSAGVFAYILVVALIMKNGERLFGQLNNYWGPVAFLLFYT